MSSFTLDITAFVEKCKAALLNGEPTPIEHKDKENLRNNCLPKPLTQSSINVYAIWSRVIGATSWSLQYIGQREYQKGWQRVGEHLFHKAEKTESKLDLVRAALSKGEEFAISAILVEPDCLRLTVECELIRVVTRDGGELAWNQKSRSKGRRPGRGPRDLMPGSGQLNSSRLIHYSALVDRAASVALGIRIPPAKKGCSRGQPL